MSYNYVLPISCYFAFILFPDLTYSDGTFFQVTCPLCAIFTRVVTLFAYIFFDIYMFFKVAFNSSLLMRRIITYTTMKYYIKVLLNMTV